MKGARAAGPAPQAAAERADERSAANRRHRRRSRGYRSGDRDKAAADPALAEVCDIVLYGPHEPDEIAAFACGRDLGRGWPRRVRRRRAARSTTREAARIDAVATAPINKEAFAAAGLPWRGHTDLLAHLTGARPVAMMFYAESLRVVLATVHIPLSEVPGALTRDAVEGDHRRWPRANCRGSDFRPAAGARRTESARRRARR